MKKKTLIIGAGHNGLVCAAYLAKAGYEVTLLERRSIPGGAAVTEEFHPGYRNSTASYTVSLLHQKIIRDLRLNDHGLVIVPRRMNNYLPMENGDSFCTYPDNRKTQEEIRRLQSGDEANYVKLNQLMAALVPLFRDQLLKTPPLLHEGGLSDLFSLFQLSQGFKNLTAEEKSFAFRLFMRSPGELLEDQLDSPVVQAWLAFDAMVGHYASPYHPGSGYVLMHHHLGEVNGQPGAWGHAMGGMGSVTEAILREAQSHGAKLRLDCDVQSLGTENNQVTEVFLNSGETLQADLVIANINPKLLFLDILSPDQVPESIQAHFRAYKCQSGTFRMNVALDKLPEFSARRESHHLESGIIMGPSLSYMDQAFEDTKTMGWSRKPIVEMLIPSTIDSSLAPEGKHVASLFCQHFDPTLGEAWDSKRNEAADAVLNLVDSFAPGFKNSVLACQIHSPRDLEQKFALTGGDIFHGRLSLEQLYSARPMLGMSQYRSHLKNLYLCGSGTHPGGGVSGMPGHNAAREIRRQFG